MRIKLPKHLLWGLLTAVIGVVLLVTPFGLMLEESVGLQALFLLRGHRAPPQHVSLLSIDAASLDTLKLPYEPTSWPRSLYSQIVQQLNAEGAKLIIFTLALEQSFSQQDADALAQVFRRAGNVVLPRYIKQRMDLMHNEEGAVNGNLTLDVVVPPLNTLDDAVLASAVFPLPKDSERIARFWTFKDNVSEPATLPVVAFHLWAIRTYYPQFVDLMTGLDSTLAASLPHHADELNANGAIHLFIDKMSLFFAQQPDAWQRALHLIKSSQSWDEVSQEVLSAWVNLYSNQAAAYLNHYGQSATVVRWPLINLLEQRKHSPFKDSVVFVGISENLFLERNYGFHTVFSSPSAKISAAEIAATATANLMHNESIQPLSPLRNIVIVLLFGLVLGSAAQSLSLKSSLLLVVVLSMSYLVVAHALFQHSIWVPIIIPILILVPLSVLCGAACRFSQTSKEKTAIHKAFSHYIPGAVVDELATRKKDSDFRAQGQLIYAVCLSTDAGQFTRLGELIEPEQLADLMNDYYDILFAPVQSYQGTISDVIGDAMLAVWTEQGNRQRLAEKACHAALEIQFAVDQFNQKQQYKLPTRLGMHAGQIRLGNIGSSSRFEYRPVGDCVNTSNRIEGLNKLLGTKTLVSAEVLLQGNRFMVRKVGTFILQGKSNPLTIYELLGLSTELGVDDVNRLLLFDKAMECFETGELRTAQDQFDHLLRQYPGDGPSLFYYQRCELHLSENSTDNWDSTIEM